MEATTCNAKLMLVLVILACYGAVVRAENKQEIEWNESVKSAVLNRENLQKLGDALATWKIKQMTWPSQEELSSAVSEVDDKLKDNCISWLVKFIDNKQLPQDLKVHLVAMNNWGLIREESKQKRLCDVFITRFRKGPYTIHIQESPSTVIVVIGRENAPSTDDVDHKSLIFETANQFLKKELRPNPGSKHIRIHKELHEEIEITRVTWRIESVISEDEKGRTKLSLEKAGKLGTSSVKAETNGKYTWFYILKMTRGPVPLGAYAERFGEAK